MKLGMRKPSLKRSILNDTPKMVYRSTKLKKNGYEVHIIATDLPVETAIERASKRDRIIDEYIVRKTHREFGKAFLDIATLEGVDSFRLYDNSQAEGQNPTLVADENGIIDNSLWARFESKGKQ